MALGLMSHVMSKSIQLLMDPGEARASRCRRDRLQYAVAGDAPQCKY
jgi:hypothetical protein